MLVAEPFRRIDHLREDEQRLKRVEGLAFVERVVKTIGAAAVEVGDERAFEFAQWLVLLEPTIIVTIT